MKKNTPNPTHLSDFLWDLWCVASIIGIWPRFIEPNLLHTTKLNLKIPKLPQALHGIKILQFSDLHLNSNVSDFFLRKLVQKIKKLSPDLIVFTGDFLCYSQMKDKIRLQQLLNSLEAPCGCFAILGNHDYEKSVSINPQGDYDIISKKRSMIKEGFSRLFTTVKLTKVVSPAAKSVGLHQELLDLLQQTPFKLLHNNTAVVPIKGSYLNLCGLGEYICGRCQPEIAFTHYDRRYPGIVLAHNPDSIPLLESFPGDIILCGHTHGGQINIPWMWKKFTLLENMNFKNGLHKVGTKWVYINRGIGSVMPFRWFARPEILLLSLESDS